MYPFSAPQPRSVSETRIFNRREGVRFQPALTRAQELEVLIE